MKDMQVIKVRTYFIYNFRCTAGVGDKYTFRAGILKCFFHILYIRKYNLFHIATVFLSRSHFTIFHTDAGMEF